MFVASSTEDTIKVECTRKTEKEHTYYSALSLEATCTYSRFPLNGFVSPEVFCTHVWCFETFPRQNTHMCVFHATNTQIMIGAAFGRPHNGRWRPSAATLPCGIYHYLCVCCMKHTHVCVLPRKCFKTPHMCAKHFRGNKTI